MPPGGPGGPRMGGPMGPMPMMGPGGPGGPMGPMMPGEYRIDIPANTKLCITFMLYQRQRCFADVL